MPETITLDDAVVTYYGDDSYSGVSDLWTLDLAQSSAGQRLVLSLNVTPNPAGVPDPGLLAGTYRMPANSGDMSAGTYNPGYMTEQDRPNGAVMVPAGTYLAGVAAETSDADLLREGACTVEVDADGRMRIEGTLVGTSYLKRYFTYEGTPQFVDGSGTSGSGVPNSNLNADVRLESLSATRIVDKGDSYFLGDESYRHFVFFLADAGIDLSTQWPGGDGELLRIELFVPWDTDPADGIPAGIYTVPDDVPPSAASTARTSCRTASCRVIPTSSPPTAERGTSTWRPGSGCATPASRAARSRSSVPTAATASRRSSPTVPRRRTALRVCGKTDPQEKNGKIL